MQHSTRPGTVFADARNLPRSLTAEDRGRVCLSLRTARLLLEPLVAAHAERLYPLLAAAELWRYNDDAGPADPAALRGRYTRLETRESADGMELWLNWAIVLAATDYVGFVQATVGPDRRTASIAYVIGKRFWSRGIATEAAGALMAFLRDELRIATIGATADARNLASLRVLAKLGFGIADASDRRNVAFVFPVPVPNAATPR